MKTGKFFGVLAAVAAIALMAASCEKFEGTKGSQVKFNAGISDGPKTKAEYGPLTTGATSQPIYWLEGDVITVYCNQCDGAKVKDYVVDEVKPSGTSSNSWAHIDNVGEHGLIWGTGTHHFYALYPSVNTSGVVATINNNIITCNIPASQGHGTISGTTTKVVPPDMKNMYMVAQNEIEAGETGDPVFLDFLPLSTALEFTIENGFESENDMIVKKVAVEAASSDVTYSNILNGGFQVNMDQTGVYGRPKTTFTGSSGGTRKQVGIDFSSSPVTVQYGNKLNFTLFLNPGNENEVRDLVFAIVLVDNVDDTKTITRRAHLIKKDNTPVVFPTHKKTIMSGLIVEEEVTWEIENELVVTSWISGSSSNIPLTF